MGLIILIFSILLNILMVCIALDQEKENDRILQVYDCNCNGYEHEIDKIVKEHSIQNKELIKIKAIQEEKLNGLDKDLKKLLDNPKDRDDILLSLKMLIVEYFPRFEESSNKQKTFNFNEGWLERYTEIKCSLIRVQRRFSYKKQSDVAIEELSELIQAIMKFNRYVAIDEIISDKSVYKSNVIEEMADVYIMLEQLKMYLAINDFDIFDMIDSKIERTIKRFKGLDKNEHTGIK